MNMPLENQGWLRLDYVGPFLFPFPTFASYFLLLWKNIPNLALHRIRESPSKHVPCTWESTCKDTPCPYLLLPPRCKTLLYAGHKIPSALFQNRPPLFALTSEEERKLYFFFEWLRFPFPLTEKKKVLGWERERCERERERERENQTISLDCLRQFIDLSLPSVAFP